MTTSSTSTPTSTPGLEARAGDPRSSPAAARAAEHDAQMGRWGGVAALAGVLGLIGSVAVVVGLELPDASDPETLTDFADIESGRIAEHAFYLGALVLFTLHGFALHRLLRRAHPAAALFGLVTATIGLVVMAGSSMLHASTAPLAELYTESGTSAEDLRAIEYAWHGAQSVFDTMLLTGVLLVPIGLGLFGVAMRRAVAYGPRLALVAIGLGVVGFVGAAIATIDTSSDLSAISVLAMVVFHLVVGWRTLTLGNRTDLTVDLADDLAVDRTGGPSSRGG